MPLFSLPLDNSSTRPSTRAHLFRTSSRKRKRSSSPHVQFVGEFNVQNSEPALEQSSLQAASTNPLSLNPDEIHQYRIAGLDLGEELPSKSVPDFPHRGLPASFPDNNDAEVDSGGLQREKRAPHLRMQHFSVLTTILQRLLLVGDIPRASRAWAMLLRAQHNGKGTDIRSSGYWGIGAELLMRGSEEPAQGRTVLRQDDSLSPESDIEVSNFGDESEYGGGQKPGGGWRWGTASGLEKVKDYYERLILQYPYTRQYHDSVNSLNFWPAMLSCEIYGIQFEQNEALREVKAEEESGDTLLGDNSSEEDENMRSDDPDAYFAAQERREAYQRVRRRDVMWKKRDEIRHKALVAVEKVAARMDQLMVTPPYSDSHVLLRLRGMLALYIGDLRVPDLFEVHPEQAAIRNRDEGSDMDDAVYGKLSEQRLLQRHRRAEHERGLAKRLEEKARARKAFEKIQREGGRIDMDIARLLRAESRF